MNYLIMSITAGEGHNSTARAIQSELEQHGAECRILDTFDYISPELAKIVSEGYLLVTEKAKYTYKIGYRLAEKRRSAADREHAPSNLIKRAATDELAEFIRADHYDAVLFTHPFAGVLLNLMKKKHIIENRTVGILTDFTFHPYWEDCTDNDYVVVPNRLLLPQARRKGFRDEQVLPLGIPINPKFSEALSTPRPDARRALGLKEDLMTFLIMGGSMGYGNMAENVRKIDAMDTDRPFQLIVVCGNNAEMKEEIDELAKTARHPMLVTGFVKTIPQMMDASDCIITKPGGLTTSEALAKHLPMIIANPIPGQEERNTEFLLNNGCAFATSKTCPMDECIYQLLTSDVRLRAMQECIAAIAKPNAAADLGRFLVDLAHTPLIADDHTSADDMYLEVYWGEEE
ncbi:MAG: glycosyltransferase [Eubacteriales bacterium]